MGWERKGWKEGRRKRKEGKKNGKKEIKEQEGKEKEGAKIKENIHGQSHSLSKCLGGKVSICSSLVELKKAKVTKGRDNRESVAQKQLERPAVLSESEPATHRLPSCLPFSCYPSYIPQLEDSLTVIFDLGDNLFCVNCFMGSYLLPTALHIPPA